MQFCRPERLVDGERCIHTFLCCLQCPLLGVSAVPAASSTQTTMLDSEWLQVTYPSLGLRMLREGHSGSGFHTWQCHSAGFSFHGWSTCSFILATLGTSNCTLSIGSPNHPPNIFLLCFLFLLCFSLLGIWRTACGEVQASGDELHRRGRIRTIQIDITANRIERRRMELETRFRLHVCHRTAIFAKVSSTMGCPSVRRKEMDASGAVYSSLVCSQSLLLHSILSTFIIHACPRVRL